MGLASLDAALSGLRASQNQISVISNNVSNATTPGYTRKLLPQYAQSIAGETVGVVSGTIVRNVDLNLSRDLWTQVSSVGASSVRSSYLSAIEEFHGPPDAELSVAAEIADLRDSFAALSDAPDDTYLLAQTVQDAVSTAEKINDLAQLIQQSRNDVQGDIQSTVNRVNQLLDQIADLNSKIQNNINVGRSSAVTEDERDEAIKELSGLMSVSFFKRGDGVLVVQSEDGVELADTTAKKLMFNAGPLAASSYYPEADIGIYVATKQFNGNPADSMQAINITERSIGGRLGGLVQLRDQDLPRAQAQLDELAHKMAMRFEAQGLTLFTDKSVSVPLDPPPDPANGIPVEYIGFSAEIQVNEAILNDHTLLRRGTFGLTNSEVPSGSNQLMNRIVEYAFGTIDFQSAVNETATTQVDLRNTGGDDLQTWLGLHSAASMNGALDLTQYTSLADMLTTAGDEVFGNAGGAPAVPETDRFTITFSDPATPLNDFSVTVDIRALSTNGAYAIGSADAYGGGTIDNAAEQLRAFINDQIAANSPANPYAAVAGLGNNGQLTFNSRSDIAFSPAGAEGVTDEAMAFLGFSSTASKQAEDPYFDIAVGNNERTRIYLQPGDDMDDLITKLQEVDGLAIGDSSDGILRLRPGNDYDDPDYGGAMYIIAGPAITNGATYADSGATTGTRASMDNNVNIVSALFGTYNVSGGGVVNNFSPVTDERYQSEVSVGSGTYVDFRSSYLGPNVDMTTTMAGSTQLIDFAQKMVNYNAQEIRTIEAEQADDESLRDILQTQLSNESGVNIDEELASLIVFQTAFSASARVITAVDEMFQELLSAV